MVVTVTDLTPPAISGWDIDKYLYRFCASYEGTPTAGMPTTIKCDEGAIGRYLYLMVPGSGHMTICEAEVGGRQTPRDHPEEGGAAVRPPEGARDALDISKRTD